MDGQHERAPAGSLFGQAISRNAWGCYVKPESWAYFPSHRPLAEVCNANDCWLKSPSGAPLFTSWGIRIWDIRHPALVMAFLEQTRTLIATCGAPFLFLDELHDYVVPESLSGTSELNEPNPAWDGSLGWNDSYRKILRLMGVKTVKNGTFPLDATSMLDGFYVQRAHQKPSLIDMLRDSVARGYRRTCIQVPVADSLKYQALAADHAGVSIQEIPAGVDQFAFTAPSIVIGVGVQIRTDGTTIRIGPMTGAVQP